MLLKYVIFAFIRIDFFFFLVSITMSDDEDWDKDLEIDPIKPIGFKLPPPKTVDLNSSFEDDVQERSSSSVSLRDKLSEQQSKTKHLSIQIESQEDDMDWDKDFDEGPKLKIMD